MSQRSVDWSSPDKNGSAGSSSEHAEVSTLRFVEVESEDTSRVLHGSQEGPG